MAGSGGGSCGIDNDGEEHRNVWGAPVASPGWFARRFVEGRGVRDWNPWPRCRSLTERAASGAFKAFKAFKAFGQRLLVAGRRLDHQHVRDATLIHAVLREVMNVPEVVRRRLDGVHCGFDRRVAMQRN